MKLGPSMSCIFHNRGCSSCVSVFWWTNWTYIQEPATSAPATGCYACMWSWATASVRLKYARTGHVSIGPTASLSSSSPASKSPLPNLRFCPIPISPWAATEWLIASSTSTAPLSSATPLCSQPMVLVVAWSPCALRRRHGGGASPVYVRRCS